MSTTCDNGRYVYVDMMRLVSPQKALNGTEFNFFMLGSFDAMKVITGKNGGVEPIKAIDQLQWLHKIRYKSVPPMFDRQPLYLYCCDELKEDVFSVTGKMKSKPLVMTLFQLQDEALSCDPNLEGGQEVENLINRFKNQIEKEASNIGNQQELIFQVFYCLGESDVAVVFRYDDVSLIGRILYRLRVWECKENGYSIRVLSNSSYCAFPAANDTDLSKNAEEWIKNEKAKNTDFLTLTNTSFGLNKNVYMNNQGKKKFKYGKYLLGEWDHCLNWNDQYPQNIFLDYVTSVKVLTDGSAAKKRQDFRTCYTIPEIQLAPEDAEDEEEQHAIKEIYKKSLFRIDKKPYNNMIKALKVISPWFSELSRSEYRKNIQQLTGTLCGLYNHLLRLLYGRFEGDLFAFVQPVFKSLGDVTQNCADLLKFYSESLNNAPKNKEGFQLCDDLSKRIGILLDTYVADLSDLISELQHMFSILSVSPYTYLETYGSNMRSIAAACKLLAAYQGIAYSLNKNFNMRFNSTKANETFLVLPYRNVTVNTKNYFEEASPVNRICRISIDFTKMFHIRYTLYILLHECGHQLRSEVLREKRLEDYYPAVVASMFDRLLGHYYRDIGKCIGIARVPAKDILDNDKWKKLPTYSIDEADEKECKKKIKDAAMQAAISVGTNWMGEWVEVYKKSNEAVSEPVALAAFLSEHMRNLAVNMFKQNSDDSNQSRERTKLREELYGLINVIFCSYGEIVEKNISKGSDALESDVWKICGFAIDYLDKEERNKKVDEVTEYILSKMVDLCDTVCFEMSDIFSEIYSDIFAFYLLGIWQDEDYKSRKKIFKLYFETLAQNCGMSINEYMTTRRMLIRLCAIEEKCVGRSVLKKCLKKGLDDETYLLVVEEIKKIKDSVCYSAVIDYTNICWNELNERLKDNHLKETSYKIRSLFNSAQQKETSQVVDLIHYFWKVSTQRGVLQKDGRSIV